MTTEFLGAFLAIKSLPASVNSIEGLQYAWVVISFLNVFPFNVSNPYKLFGKPINCYHYSLWSKSCGFVDASWLDTLNVFHIFYYFVPSSIPSSSSYYYLSIALVLLLGFIVGPILRFSLGLIQDDMIEPATLFAKCNCFSIFSPF